MAALALVLAIVGIYGVMAYYVNQRRRETAIRRALGARASDVVNAMLAAACRLTVLGIALGVVGAFVMGQGLSSMLFRVSPYDPAAVAIVAAALASAALLACAVPALRIVRIDPASVLRDE